MSHCAVLVEGDSDIPVIRELFVSQFNLKEKRDFSLHSHRGRGSLPVDLLGAPPAKKFGLLDLLPSTLRGMSHKPLVVVLIDLDGDDLNAKTEELERMLQRLPKRPIRVLFRFAIEETESWFIADLAALKSAFRKVDTRALMRIQPDAIVGAWEHLADALKFERRKVTGTVKYGWAKAIAPHLNFVDPPSPSLKQLITDLKHELGEHIKP
jgi:hypothetical protein